MDTGIHCNIPYIQYIRPDGTFHNDARGLPTVSGAFLENLFEQMLFTRIFDQTVRSLQRNGVINFYTSSEGEEAIGIAIANAATEDDRLVMSYRQHGAHLMRCGGVNCADMMVRIMLYFDGDERGNVFDGVSARDFPICVPIATQCPQAVGVAMARTIRGESHAVLTVVGDGGTSEGDFYVSLNAAALWKLPLVFVIANNEWAISVPRKLQSGSETLAQKGIAAGIKHSVQVDGNDVLAVYTAVDDALKRARSGGGPSVIEALTYRIGNHTTIDDARRYRDETDVERARAKEPLIRLRRLLKNAGIWSDDKEMQFSAECEKFINEAIEAFKKIPSEPPTAMIDYLHETLPEALAEQRERMGR